MNLSIRAYRQIGRIDSVLFFGKTKKQQRNDALPFRVHG